MLLEIRWGQNRALSGNKLKKILIHSLLQVTVLRNQRFVNRIWRKLQKLLIAVSEIYQIKLEKEGPMCAQVFRSMILTG